MKFNIQCDIPDRWVDTFCSFLKRMEHDGRIGHSELIGFLTDGDGDFHPSFNIQTIFECDINKKEPYVYSNREASHIFDAG